MVRSIEDIVQVENLPSSITALLSDEKIKNYTGMGKRASRFLDAFKITYDKPAIERIVSCYAFWLKVVDDEMDEGDPEIIERVLAHLDFPDNWLEDSYTASIYATEEFKKQINPAIYDEVIPQLYQLYKAVKEERSGRNIQAYIERRKDVGNLTGEIMYQLIEPKLATSSQKARNSFMKLCEVGCLFDSCVDIMDDYENLVLGFKPKMTDRMMLYASTMKETATMFVSYPELLPEFVDIAKRNARYLIQVFIPSKKTKDGG